MDRSTQPHIESQTCKCREEGVFSIAQNIPKTLQVRCGTRFTFKKEERIHYKRDFERIFKEGRRYKGKGFTLILHKRDSPPLRRLGIIVSRKLKGAVKRNRSKRLFREFFRLNKESFPSPSDAIVIIYTPFPSYFEVERELKRLLVSISKARC